MKRAFGEKLEWTDLNMSKLSAPLKRKVEAWLKAEAALKEAKAEVTAAFNQAGAVKKLINSQQTYRFCLGYQGQPRAAVAEIVGKKATKSNDTEGFYL